MFLCAQVARSRSHYSSSSPGVHCETALRLMAFTRNIQCQEIFHPKCTEMQRRHSSSTHPNNSLELFEIDGRLVWGAGSRFNHLVGIQRLHIRLRNRLKRTIACMSSQDFSQHDHQPHVLRWTVGSCSRDHAHVFPPLAHARAHLRSTHITCITPRISLAPNLPACLMSNTLKA